jgi:hypothetical protein
MTLSITTLAFAECHNPEYHYVECRVLFIIMLRDIMQCRYAQCHYAECHYAECHNAECCYAEYHYAECRVSFSVMRGDIVQSVFMLLVIMLGVAFHLLPC